MLTTNKKHSSHIIPIPDIHYAHTWLEISKSAILHNLSQYKKIMGQNVLAPVIKANAYGHGLREIASICEQSPHVGWLCLTLLSDALLLRQYGIGKPILVLGPIDTDITYAVNQNIEFVAYNKQIIEQLNSVGNKHNYIFGIHVKIDSGLSRIGIAPQKALTFIKYCNALPNIKVSGICTHLAEAQKENQCFTLQQISVFNTILKNMQKKHIKIPYKHVANTAATTIVPLNYCNFFRVGIGIYGLWPSEYVKKETQKKEPSFILKPCLAWKTRIIEVKKISAQSFVGYNRTHQVKRNSIVAILPVGYFDGYDMRFSDIACVRINDAYANIIGRVCMNHTIIDVTDIPNVNIGDEVILLGNDPKISAYYFATLTGNNNVREILTKIFPHIARIIIE